MLPFLYGLLLFLLQLTTVLITYHSHHFSAFQTTNIPLTNFQTTPTSQILIFDYFMDTSYLRPLDKMFYTCKIMPELTSHPKMITKTSNYFFRKSHPRNRRKPPILNHHFRNTVNRYILYLTNSRLNQTSFKQAILTKFNALSHNPTNNHLSNEASTNAIQHRKTSKYITNPLVDPSLSTKPLANCITTNFIKPTTFNKTFSNLCTESLILHQYFYKSATIILVHSSTFSIYQETSNRFIPGELHILLLEPTNHISLTNPLNKHNLLTDLLTINLNVFLYLTLSIFINHITDRQSIT